MILLNPKQHSREYPDERSREVMLKTIEFFESRGKIKLKEDDHARGLYPMAGSSIRLPRQIPYCLAAEIVLLGRHITAREALEWGLVNRLVPKGEVLAEAKKIAEQLGETGPLALKAVTRSLRELQTDVAESAAMLKSDDLAGPVFASQDAKEGMRAFKEKRKAVFEGK